MFVRRSLRFRPSVFGRLQIYREKNVIAFSGQMPDMAVQHAVITREWKGIHYSDDDSMALFNRREDPQERSDLSSEHPSVAQEMEGRIRKWVEDCRKTAPYNISLFDEEALQKLKAMGYLK